MSGLCTLRLSQLGAQIDQVIKNAFDQLQFWVMAEVATHNYSVDKQYHAFDLVEKVPGSNNLIAKFPARAWGNGSRCISLFESRTGQKFTNNIQILILVKVRYSAPRGLKLELVDIDHTFTLDILEQQRQQTLEKLCLENPQHVKKQGEEYWTHNKSLHLPLVIQNIAVVTGRNSQGWHDFQHTIENNTFGYKLIITPYYTEVLKTRPMECSERLSTHFRPQSHTMQ